MPSAAPTEKMGNAKTQLIRGAGVEAEPVAGWVVVVKGPGRGAFRPVYVGMNSVGRDPSQRVSLSFGDEFDLARGARLHHLRRGAALLLSAARRQIEPGAAGHRAGAHPRRAQAQRSHSHRQDHADVRRLLRPRLLLERRGPGRMSIVLASAARATTGARSGQEDAFQLWPADGVGRPDGERRRPAGGARRRHGRAHRRRGRRADRLLDLRRGVLRRHQRLTRSACRPALHASNEALAKGVEENAALRGMGCTIVAAWIDALGIRWASVGDSLLLLYRFPDVIRLNADHSLGSFLDEQARQNRITASEAKQHHNRNALRSALTGAKIDLIDLRSEPLELQAGDWILIASDGICSLEGDEIADVVYNFRQSTPAEMADGLIAAVVRKAVAGQDNTTVVAIRVDPAKAAGDVETTRVLRGRANKEEKELRSRRIGRTGRKTSIPGPPCGPAHAGRDLAGGGRGLLPVLRRGDPAAVDAIDDRSSTPETTQPPPLPRRPQPPFRSRRPRMPPIPRVQDAPRQRIPAAPRRRRRTRRRRRPRTPPSPRPHRREVPRRRRKRAVRRRRQKRPAARAAGNARAAVDDGCPGFASRCPQSLRRPRRPAPNLAKPRSGPRGPRRRGGPRTRKARNPGASAGGEGGKASKDGTQESAQGAAQGCPALGLQQ